MKAETDITELKNFLDYLSDKIDDANRHEVDLAIDRFLKERLSIISGDTIKIEQKLNIIIELLEDNNSNK